MKKGNTMTPTEFKAWFDGFTEALDGIPNEDQWKRIKARVAEIDGKPTSYPVYIDRYWPTYQRTWGPYWGTYCGTSSTYTTTPATSLAVMSSGTTTNGGSVNHDFNSITAMYALGKADAHTT
jgi:hypothetical protein